MYEIVLGSEWNENHATKNQANFQGPFLAPSAEGINLKCRLGQEKQKELMEQHVQDLFTLPGHLKLFENNRAVRIKRDSKHQGTVFTATQHPVISITHSWLQWIQKSIWLLKWKSGPPKYRIKFNSPNLLSTGICDSYQMKLKCKTPSLFLLKLFLIEELASCILNSISFCCMIKK